MLLGLIKTTLVAAFLADPVSLRPADEGDGIVRVRSAVAMDEAIARIRRDIAAKGIKLFVGVSAGIVPIRLALFLAICSESQSKKRGRCYPADPSHRPRDYI